LFCAFKEGAWASSRGSDAHWITHITKLEFLPCFKCAFDAAITKDNIQGDFQGAGFVPFDPEAVILQLDIWLHMPTPPPVNNTPSGWQLQTPSNTLEFGSQSKLIQERIQQHADNLPTSMVDTLKKFATGVEMMAHQMVLMRNQVAELQAANKAATQCKSCKRKRVQKEGTLTVEEGVRLTALKEFNTRSDWKKAKKRAHVEVGKPS
jgi:hypothetical protein